MPPPGYTLLTGDNSLTGRYLLRDLTRTTPGAATVRLSTQRSRQIGQVFSPVRRRVARAGQSRRRSPGHLGVDALQIHVRGCDSGMTGERTMLPRGSRSKGTIACL